MIRYFDTHTHVNFKDLAKDEAAVMARAATAGVAMVNVGTDYETSQAAIALAEKYDFAWASVGLHPNDFYLEKGFYSDFDAVKFKELAKHKRVVAIGETGLDFYRTKSGEDQKIQAQNFLKHIEIVTSLKKALIVHCREAYNSAYEIIKTHRESLSEFVIHSFTGDWPTAKLFLDLGGFLSFNGIITFARQYDDVVRNAPLGQIVLETDAPFLTPTPHRGKRNEPSYVKFVAEKIAELKGVSIEEIAAVTTENAKKLYKLD